MAYGHYFLYATPRGFVSYLDLLDTLDLQVPFGYLGPLAFRLCLSTLKLWFYFSTSTHSSSLPGAHIKICIYFFFKRHRQISQICHPARLCIVFGGSGIQVFVKENFWRIFGGGWEETNTGGPNTAPLGTQIQFFCIQSTLFRVFKPTKS